MESNNSNTLNTPLSTPIADDIASIKKCLTDLTASVFEISKQLTKIKENSLHANQLVATGLKRLTTRQQFFEFNNKLIDRNDELENFINSLNGFYKNNENTIKNDLEKYFKIVLVAIFSNDLIQKMSWGKYGDNINVGKTMTVHAIEQSASIVDGTSFEYDRLKIFQKTFTKLKDSKRIRTKKATPIQPIATGK